MSLENQEDLAEATFAGGCFWCVEAVLERVKGVDRVVSGYSGGSTPDPTYKQVARGRTDYAEAVKVFYDSSQVSYHQLLEVFFKVAHDPTQLNRQGPDVGKQYRSAVFYHNEKQQREVLNYINQLEAQKVYEDEIVTEINKLKKFYPAEDYHQNYYDNNPGNPYIMRYAVPKVKKLKKKYPEWFNNDYMSKS